MSRTQFGIYTRKLRVRAGLSQIEVARRLGFKSGQLVSNWERGTCYPPLESMTELAKMYHVSLRVFFDEYFEHHKEENWRRLKKG